MAEEFVKAVGVPNDTMLVELVLLFVLLDSKTTVEETFEESNDVFKDSDDAKEPNGVIEDTRDEFVLVGGSHSLPTLVGAVVVTYATFIPVIPHLVTSMIF